MDDHICGYGGLHGAFGIFGWEKNFISAGGGKQILTGAGS